jgi:hypothetical protein
MWMTPRNIHGTVVYQTEDEDRRLTRNRIHVHGCFLLVGLGLSLAYLRKWGIVHAIKAEAEEDDSERESP